MSEEWKSKGLGKPAFTLHGQGMSEWVERKLRKLCCLDALCVEGNIKNVCGGVRGRRRGREVSYYYPPL